MLESLARLFEEGGPPMYFLLALGALGLAATVGAGLFALLWKARRVALGVAVGLVALGLLILAVGFLGQAWGLRQMNAALAQVNPEDVAIIQMVGSAEARAPVILALLLCQPPLVTGIALVGLGWLRLKAPAAEPSPPAFD